MPFTDVLSSFTSKSSDFEKTALGINLEHVEAHKDETSSSFEGHDRGHKHSDC
jgi:hypothetical protein